MNKTINIALVSHVDWTSHGGVQKHTLALGEALKKLGVSVTYISPTPQKADPPQPHIQIGQLIRVPTPNGSWGSISRTIKTPNQIRDIITKNKFDLLHFQELIAPSISWQIIKVSSVPNLATFHTGWNKNAPQESLQPLINQIGQNLKPYLTASIAVSPTAAQTNRQIIQPPLHIIPNAVDLSLFTTRHPKPKQVDSNKLNLLFIGRFEERKGLPHLLQSLKYLPSNLKAQITLNIIGSGPQIQLVKKQIKELNNKPTINLLGYVSDSQKAAYLQHSDLFIAPSTGGESFGIVLIESLAAGTPVIAGNNDGYSYLLRHYPYKDGIVDVTNHHLFAQIITHLATHPRLRRQLSRWGKTFANQYSADKIALKHLNLYQKILSNYQPLIYSPPRSPHNIGFYKTQSKPKKILLLHGQKGGALRFKSIITYLSRDYQVIAPDLPGYGNSPTNQPHTTDHYTDILKHWISDQKLSNFSIIGLSMGGIIAIKLLKKLNFQPKKLILLATPVNHKHLTLNTKQNLIKFLTHPYLLKYPQIYQGIDRIIKSDRLMTTLYQLIQPNIIDPKTLAYEIDQWRQQPSHVMAETAHDLLQTDLTQEPLNNIPTIYLYTPKDNYVNMKQTIPAIKAILPNTKFISLNLDKHVPQGEISLQLVKQLTKSIKL